WHAAQASKTDMDLLLTALPAPSYSLKPSQNPAKPHHHHHNHRQRKSQRRRQRRRQSVSIDNSRLIESNCRQPSDASARRLSDAACESLHQPVRLRQQQQKQQQQQSNNKGRTVYYSLRQTESLVDCGVNVPGAPPATPLPIENPGLKYVLSMQDTKSKRELSLRLTEIRDKRKDNAKRSDLKSQLEEREREQARLAKLRVEQRNRIYALNKLMTELELTDFKTFRASKEAN
ncbi:hypothetical protein BOX15_Mlig017488g3, partial [Macrostomum lignano]